MKIVVNGIEKIFDDNITIDEVLEQLQIKNKVMAVAINMNIVKKNNWVTHKINDADKLELLQFVGGG